MHKSLLSAITLAKETLEFVDLSLEDTHGCLFRGSRILVQEMAFDTFFGSRNKADVMCCPKINPYFVPLSHILEASIEHYIILPLPFPAPLHVVLGGGQP